MVHDQNQILLYTYTGLPSILYYQGPVDDDGSVAGLVQK